MRPSNDLKNLGGGMALVGMLLLASPGVRVHADEAQTASSSSSGLSCNAAPELNASVDTTHLVEYYRQQALQAPPDADEPRMLNNRGYNYGPPPGIDPTQVAFEAAGRR